jgi:hypothetical protein
MKGRKVNWLFGFLAAALITAVFYWQVPGRGLIPVPVDALVGLYHPFRDAVRGDYPAGIPYRNFLITDPVRQQIPWRRLVVGSWRKRQLPGWNPYQFAGVPLLANPQAGTFSPFTLPFFILDFLPAWVAGIILQTFLALWFSYLFLRGRDLSPAASLLGGMAFAFGGFATAWLTWGTVLATALWLPLLLFLIERRGRWRPAGLALITALSVFSGHLQIAFYVLGTALAFAVFYRDLRAIAAMLVGLGLAAVQLLPSLGLILGSARWQNPGEFLTRPDWFLPYRHLIQIIAPDFFGNPATLNYWGEFNYGEFVAYVGMLPLLLAVLSLGRFRKTAAPLALVFFSLLLALPTPAGRLLAAAPFLDSLKPSRLLFLTTFGLAWMAAVGFDSLRTNGRLKLRFPAAAGLSVGLLLLVFWAAAGFWPGMISGLGENVGVARRNLILPSLLFAAGAFLLLSAFYFRKRRHARLNQGVIIAVLLLSGFDLFRFGWKFTPFTQRKWFFPETQTLGVLRRRLGSGRFLTLDRRLLPPNVGSFYQLASPEGYDPLFPADYGRLAAAWERDAPDESPFNFNRIVRPERFPHRVADLLGVDYVLSLSDLDRPGLVKIAQEGETRVYRNLRALPRAFVAAKVRVEAEPEAQLARLWAEDFRPAETAVVPAPIEGLREPASRPGRAEVVSFAPNRVVVRTRSETEGLLVLTDRFEPDWRVSVDGRGGEILRADLVFRGVLVPAGEHLVEFVYRPHLFYLGLALSGLSLAILAAGWFKFPETGRRFRGGDD